MRLEISQKAQNDIYSLQDFGNANFGVLHTRCYLAGLKHTFKNLRGMPELARLREEYGGTVRVHPHRSHLIFYRIEGETAKVLRVLSKHQNWPDHI